MEPAVLLKHVAVQSHLCLPATQRVIAAQNKHESIKAAKTDRGKVHLQYGNALLFISSFNADSHHAAFTSKDSMCKIYFSVFYAVARSILV